MKSIDLKRNINTLGKMYFNGCWYQKNERIGLGLIERSASLGDQKAGDFLEDIIVDKNRYGLQKIQMENRMNYYNDLSIKLTN